MIKRIIQVLLGIIFFPICIAASTALYEQLAQVNRISDNQKYFIGGVAVYLVIHIVFFKPEYLYILGHEIMHVLATWITGGKVSSFKVSSRGGKVTVNKSNIFIALAPYFFPFYTITVATVFFIASVVAKIGFPYSIFMFLLGFSLTFHIILTIDFLKIKQTDFLHMGYLLSICVIYTVNILTVGFICSLIFEDVIFTDFFASIYFKAKDIYLAIFRQLFM